MKKEATPKCKGLKRKSSYEKKRQPQNTRGSKERPLIKEEATPKRKGLKKRPLMKKRQLQNARGSKQKSLMKKEATPNTPRDKMKAISQIKNQESLAYRS
jgi:hypothetical protein